MVTRYRKCANNNFGRKMELLLSVIILELVFVSGQYVQSPCPGIFDYQNSGGQVVGVITLQPSGPTTSITIRANFTIAARLPTSSYIGQLQPVDLERGLQRYNQGAPLLYLVHFPVTSPLPHLYSLVVNDQQICYGPMDTPEPNQYFSTISLQNMLFLRGGVNSVYPGNQSNFVKPSSGFNSQGDMQVFTSSGDKLGAGFQSSVVDKNDVRFNVYESTKTTQSPGVNQFNPFLNQPPPNYNSYTTQRQPVQPPPDYTTQRQPVQLQPDYTTQRQPIQPPPAYTTQRQPVQPPPDYTTQRQPVQLQPDYTTQRQPIQLPPAYTTQRQPVQPPPDSTTQRQLVQPPLGSTTQRQPVRPPPDLTTQRQTVQPPPVYSTQRQPGQPPPDYKTQRLPVKPLPDYTTQRQPVQPPPDSTTQRQPVQPPPDYNPYTTLPPQQVPLDFNPYTTEQPRSQPQPSLPANPPRISSGSDISLVECGTVAGGNNRQPLIYNGQSFERGEWPWLVAIYKTMGGALSYTCGGTLISKKHIVTAAHCIYARSTITSNRDVVVKIGVYDLDDWSDDKFVTRGILSADIPESYNSTSKSNDIAVFTLDKYVEFSDNIRPACLWEGNADLNSIVGASGVVAGWGSTELGAGGRGTPRMAHVPVVSTTTCRASKSEFHVLTSDTTLCAGDRTGIGPCTGDSGGGLYILDSGRWRLRGVVSLSLRPESGEHTCNTDQYIIFTDAAKFNPWIRNIVITSQI